MSNYTKTVDFASKDALTTGNPLKAVKGTEINTEFANIATAVATKEDTANKNANNGYAGLDSGGALVDSVLSSNVPLKNAANTFTQTQTITTSGAVSTFLGGDAGVGWTGTATNHPYTFWTNNVLRGTIAAAGGWSIAAPASGTTLNVGGLANNNTAVITAPNTASQSYGLVVQAGTNASDYSFRLVNAAGSADMLRAYGDGGITLGAPAGDDKGAGTINTAGTIYQNNVPVALTDTVLSGTYAPTNTNLTNITSSTTGSAQYMRVGSVVTVSGSADVVVTSGSLSTVLELTLPIASTLSAAGYCVGYATSTGGTSTTPRVTGNTSTNKASLSWTSVGTGSQTVYYHYTYRIV